MTASTVKNGMDQPQRRHRRCLSSLLPANDDLTTQLGSYKVIALYSTVLFGMLRDRKFHRFMQFVFLPSVRQKRWPCRNLSLSSELRIKSYGLRALEKRH